MAELYMYYTVLYRKISGLRRRYNTNYIVMTNYTRGPLNQTVSYRSISYSDPALLQPSFEPVCVLYYVFICQCAANFFFASNED